jgi:tetratricopeptide (TPR) repeat protein
MIDPGEISAARHALGRLLAEYRGAAGLKQRQLAPYTHYGRSTIANVETGRQNVPRDFWERADGAVNAGGGLLAAADELEALVQRQRVETAQLADIKREREQHQPGAASGRWSRQSGSAPVGGGTRCASNGVVAAVMGSGVPRLAGIFTPDDEERLTRVVDEPRLVDAETVEYFRQLLDAHTHADRNLTPADLIIALTPAYEILGRFRRVARPPVRGCLHTLASRYAQLISRMHYEAGDLAAASSWSDQALVAAHEAGDEQLVAYILARRASLVGAVGDAGQVVDLAVAARERVSLPAHLDAMARRHEAQGHAMAGDADLCFRRLDEAAELLSHGSDSTDTPYASGFSLGFHDVQAAGCYLELGRSAEAADILERELPNFRADYVKAHNLARLAQAYADMHERDRATEVARSALALARQTGSGRARQALRRIQGDLAVWWD